MTANSQVWLVLILAGLSERQEKEGGGGGEGKSSSSGYPSILSVVDSKP